MMVQLTRGSRLYVCKFHNIPCYFCKIDLEGKYTVSRPAKKFCINCAIKMNFISKSELRALKIPLKVLEKQILGF